ncbi:T9SS type A sorting domain-containing protein [Flavobacterium sp. CAU 1735]|uniref:T9SS type A sorting domain-containing protein n=1 Tax=Flavobacterium sp. CAU 1735 TaxID=3140361 RepID=UPI00325FE52E
MSKKLRFIVLFLTALAGNAFSQAYIPMLNNSSWNIVSANFGGSSNLIINPGTDVVIGSYTYKKFFDPTTNSDTYLREDVATKKVYRNIGGVDRILYDFSLQVSNTITLGNGSTYTVISITNIPVNGGTRRKFFLDNGFFSENWIEGVGSSQHPLRPSYEMPSDPYIYLTCSAQNGVNIYNHNLANGQPTATDCTMLSVDELSFKSRDIQYAPNPFTTELYITAPSDFKNATIKVFNSIGQLVRELTNVNGNTITVRRDNLNSGIYFVRIQESGKIMATNKIILTN